MSDTLMTIIGIFVAVVLMFVLPLTIMANKNDEIAQTVVQVAVSDFVETVTNQGKITEFDYNKLVQKISATGNAYDIQIEAQIIDDNPRRATTTTDSSLTGEYKYYSVYTNTIMDKVESEGVYELKKDDYVIVSVKNTNITLGTQFKNLFYKLTGKETYIIGTSSSGVVVNSNSNVEHNIEISKEIQETEKEKNVVIKTKKIVQETETKKLEVAVILDCERTTIMYHNESKNSPQSTEMVQNIIDAVKDKGNVYFILNCTPNVVYNASDDVSWVKSATRNDGNWGYGMAMNTALNTLNDKDGIRCIVFLSWLPGRQALFYLFNNLGCGNEKYDFFFTTPCCGNYDPNVDENSDDDEKDYTYWYFMIPDEKNGGNLFGKDIKAKFESLVEKMTIKQGISENEYTATSTNLKIKLDNYNPKNETIITVNDSSYSVGNAISTEVIYLDQNTYVLDLENVKEFLSISDEDWENAEIQIEYLI